MGSQESCRRGQVKGLIVMEWKYFTTEFGIMRENVMSAAIRFGKVISSTETANGIHCPTEYAYSLLTIKGKGQVAKYCRRPTSAVVHFGEGWKKMSDHLKFSFDSSARQDLIC